MKAKKLNTLSPEEAALKAKKIEAYTKQKIRVFCFSTGFTLFMIVALGGTGYLLDLALGTDKKHFFIIGLVLSYPTTQYFLYKKFKARKIDTMIDLIPAQKPE